MNNNVITNRTVYILEKNRRHARIKTESFELLTKWKINIVISGRYLQHFDKDVAIVLRKVSRNHNSRKYFIEIRNLNSGRFVVLRETFATKYFFSIRASSYHLPRNGNEWHVCYTGKKVECQLCSSYPSNYFNI